MPIANSALIRNAWANVNESKGITTNWEIKPTKTPTGRRHWKKKSIDQSINQSINHKSINHFQIFVPLNRQKCTNRRSLIKGLHNCQKWKIRFAMCPCHEPYRVEAVGLDFFPIILVKLVQFLWEFGAISWKYVVDNRLKRCTVLIFKI